MKECLEVQKAPEEGLKKEKYFLEKSKICGAPKKSGGGGCQMVMLQH